MIKKEQLDLLMQAIKMGMTDTDACNISRISRSIFYAKQKKDIGFAEELSAARSKWKQSNMAIIQKAALKSWQPAAWLLERKFPEEFANRQRLEHTGKDGAPIPIMGAVADLAKMNYKTIEKLGDKIDAFLRPKNKPDNK